MTGIFFMTIGCISFLIGLSIYWKSSHALSKAASLEVRGRSNEMKFETSSQNSSNLNTESIKNLIAAYAADGIFTKKERDSLEMICKDQKLNYVEIAKEIESIIAHKDNIPEVETIDYNLKNGLDFEKYIIQKFNKKYYRTLEWAGDKFIKGHYSENSLNPDIVFELNTKAVAFAVECKWRKSTYQDGINVANDKQLERYRIFQEKQGIPVFIALGIGGRGSDPERLFIIPLHFVDNPLIFIHQLSRFEKNNLTKDLYFDYEKETLR